MGLHLTTPNLEKKTMMGGGLGFSFASSSMQGKITEFRGVLTTFSHQLSGGHCVCVLIWVGWRVSMEDADICCPNLDLGIQLYGIFDGHGGRNSSWVARKMQRFYLYLPLLQVERFLRLSKPTSLRNCWALDGFVKGTTNKHWLARSSRWINWWTAKTSKCFARSWNKTATSQCLQLAVLRMSLWFPMAKLLWQMQVTQELVI